FLDYCFGFNNILGDTKPNILLRVQNTSAYILSAKPFITISKVFGGEKKLEIEDKRILPENIRKWQQNVNLGIGIYNAQVSVSLGSGKYVYKNTTFLVFPLKQIIFYILILITMVFVILARKRIKRAIFVFFKKS
ncbi:MAG: hypothetical protein M1524_03205, partial [Patescibacteria group bacterium]|nr:hypothetical protein [Patescibacteria group bacterium]